MTVFLFQTVVTEINNAIGAEGVLSVECKEVVSEYGELLWDLLVSGVSSLCPTVKFSLHLNCSLCPFPSRVFTPQPELV